ncbi:MULTISPECIES: MATE family efflux transporter [Pseudobutyrivibrio]|uniref:Probable multidrug resistance protein NorM n=1 Tax=Pseudobutyrivibrio xylanivorans DSM 14809 TaxID=1123012 RepID=A0A1M6K8A0_PSEXY|nr:MULTISPECIES: MATE family efflux transporter [Pseudobutyrivibrio]MDC7278916.1 MATE family efflux transporter [Butyrivibrio fibrisolvens]SHJ55188.1 putative efflux protein, MATE family [Pseudobutyrivibrio xylanivorans DSM 14809]
MLAKFKKTFIGDKAFYRRYIFLATPMIIQNFITNFVSFLDNIMVGQLGQEAISAVATVNQLHFVFALAVFGAASAGSIYGAQYFGKGDHKGHMYTFRFKLYATLLATFVGILIFKIFGSQLISLFLTESEGASPELALEYGLQYLGIILVGLIPFAVNQAYATNIKETGQTVVPMVAGMVAVATNAVLDYCLIFGFGPFPEMGVRGAALATVIARYIECAIVLIWAHSHRELNRYLEGAYTGFGLPTDVFRQILIKGAPLMLNEVLWAAGMSMVTQSYSVRGMNVLTALSMSNTIANLFNIVFIQLGACISIVVGQHLGAGELEEAKDADNKMIAFSVFCCTIMAIIMFAFGGLFPRIYNVAPEIRSLATRFIAVAAIWMPSCSFSHCSYFTLRSGGKTLVTFLFDSVFTWIVVAPCAFILAHYTGLGIVWVYFFVQGTELIKNIMGYFMVKSDVWLVQMV